MVAVKKTYLKTIIREIKNNFGRFVAIFAIVALGVGFLAGLLAATPDMKASVDQYYDETHMADIFIKSTMGLTSADIVAVSSMDGMERIMPAYVTDVLMKTNHEEVLATRIYGLPLDKLNEKDDGFVNQLNLIKGRMPQAKNECLVERSGNYLSDLQLGVILAISEENEDYKNIGDKYNTTEYTVVGIVSNPFYMSTERESSSIGNGRIGAIMYVDESCYALDVYTDFYITVKEASVLTAFTQAYVTSVKEIVTKLEALGESRSAVRYADIISEARSELDKGKTEYADAKAEAEVKLADARKDIEDGKAEIAKAEAELSDGRKKLSDGEAQLSEERLDYEEQINTNEAAIKDGEAQIAAAETTLSDSKKKLDTVKGDIEQAKTLLAAGITLPGDILAQIKQYDAGLEAYTAGMSQVQEKKDEIISSKALLNAGKKEAEAKFSAAAAKLEKARMEITDGEITLEKSKQDLIDGEAKYNKSKKEAEEELGKAERELIDAEKKIADIENPKWYVLDRGSTVSYASFSMNVEKVGAIATVFPIFFFLIAALVALTTMSRMVEEERTQIGTLKALGYAKGVIMIKYIVYCGLASVLGSITGLLAGFQLLPSVIWNAYSTMYHLPSFITHFSWPFAVVASALAILCTMVATISACHQALKERPATLMLPRAPKAGKRIFLERIHFIWSHMKFSYKATARNLLRYKKHFFMTVIGIAGCTALIVTGFGLRESIGSIANTQFDELLQYDLRIELNENDHFDTLLKDFLKDTTQIDSYTEVFSETGTAKQNGESITATIFIPKNPTEFHEAVLLMERKSGDEIVLGQSSVIVTEKLAEVMGMQPGDAFTVENAAGKKAEFVLSGITENYVGNYLYIGQESYTRAFDVELSYNTLLVKTMINDASKQDTVLTRIFMSETVSNAEFVSQTKKSFDNLLSSINFIVIVLIMAAGALAVIVLYNLTNININERRKELATLKVLGFHHKEVAVYIFRETSILSVIGSLVGLLLGVLLHAFVVRTAESTDMMLGRSISVSSFVLSATVTLLFSGIVDLMMYRKLTKIKMVDSMKAID